MQVHYYKTYSNHLQREMEYKTYGTEGQGVLVFPSQDQRFYEWEDNGMIDVLAPMIEAGKFHLICADSIDLETWSVPNIIQDEARRENRQAGRIDYRSLIEQHERWFRYITEELIPAVSQGQKLVVTGCSMGGYHAGNAFFRRPDLFDTLLSLSGLFHADYFFPGFEDSGLPHSLPEPAGNFVPNLGGASTQIFNNSPLHFLPTQTDPNLLNEQYRQKRIILCCGQGNYERVTVASTRALGQLLNEKQIPVWVDIWGNDVSHDFYWWRKQAEYLFGKLFNEQMEVAI
ncbi:MAG: alpha/beta hydrolase-fold protein [Bacteroidales bacterium]|nr:alpha/beta hydrolase-fold protein [Bacteroidales bacterium]